MPQFRTRSLTSSGNISAGTRLIRVRGRPDSTVTTERVREMKIALLICLVGALLAAIRITPASGRSHKSAPTPLP
jgi:hypothetical protein